MVSEGTKNQEICKPKAQDTKNKTSNKNDSHVADIGNINYNKETDNDSVEEANKVDTFETDHQPNKPTAAGGDTASLMRKLLL